MKRGITDLVNDWIESIKSSLEAYGKQSDETLTSLYAAARDEYNKSYNAALDTLNARYEADKKQAYTKKAADDKNMGEFLAARGLSRSGESVSARIASDVSLGNTLSALSGGLRESQNALASDYWQSACEICGRGSKQEAAKRPLDGGVSASPAGWPPKTRCARTEQARRDNSTTPSRWTTMRSTNSRPSWRHTKRS